MSIYADCPKCETRTEWDPHREFAFDGLDAPEDDQPELLYLIYECNMADCGTKWIAEYELSGVSLGTSFEPRASLKDKSRGWTTRTYDDIIDQYSCDVCDKIVKQWSPWDDYDLKELSLERCECPDPVEKD
jgi:hypothetical protein